MTIEKLPIPDFSSFTQNELLQWFAKIGSHPPAVDIMIIKEVLIRAKIVDLTGLDGKH